MAGATNPTTRMMPRGARRRGFVGRTRRWALALALLTALLAGWLPATGALPAQAIVAGPLTAEANEYVVLYAEGASVSAARAAIRAAGGTIVRENVQVGVATIHADTPDFMVNARRQGALAGVARNVPVGRAPGDAPTRSDPVEREGANVGAARALRATVQAGEEPLADRQWDMRMINATKDGSYAVQKGDRRVLVGVIDTGVDGTHPDIAPNFSLPLSRNFTTDIPVDGLGNVVDGPCEFVGCVDPADHDDNGHGTHVASTIAAPLNGLGIGGVAPNVTIVNLRAGQDSGFFFLQPTVDALTYAGDNGIDVVNMSFFIDPWRFNCTNNPADSPEQQAEQRTVITATQRALDYAHEHGVTLIASMGNEHTDLDAPLPDDDSPNYPAGTAHPRTIDRATCHIMPTEGKHVLSITAVGPSRAKADYSNYGLGEATVAAPGGYFRDNFGTDQYRVNENEILAAYPKNVGIAAGAINPGTGEVNAGYVGLVIRDCLGDVCGYYQYLQGTSMASPHATGVAALIISRFGVADVIHAGGVTMDPAQVEQILRDSAQDTPCPTPPTVDYTITDRPAEYNATCKGTANFNNFYGDGIIDALKAVPTVAPTLATVSPATITAGSADTPIALTGTGFVPGAGSVATLNGVALATTRVDDTHLAATIPAAQLATAGQYALTVTNPGPGGGTSNPITLTVTNSAPILTSLDTSSVTAGAGNTTLILTGSGFAPDATVGFGGTTLTPTATSATELTVTVPTAALATPRTALVTVTNPGPGGGTSAPLPFVIAAPPAGSPAASVAPTSLAFADQLVGTASTPKPVTLTNTGGSPLAIAGVALTGTNPGEFALAYNTCVGSLVPGAACVIGVAFAPTAVGARTASLTITDGAAGSPRTVPLSGTGAVGQFTVSASATGPGTVNPTGDTDHGAGNKATYTATATGDAVFLGWTLDGVYVGFANPLEFAVNGDRTLAATFAARPTFGDVPANDPDREAITFLAALGIINPNGVNGTGQFQPNREVARAEMAAFVARVFGWEGEFHANAFPDRCDPQGNCIDDELWNTVAALADYGVVGGYTDPATCTSAHTTAPCYLPRDPVLRLQVVSIVARAFTKTPDLRTTGFWDRRPADPALYTNVPDAGSQRSDLATYHANAGAVPGAGAGATFPDPLGNATRRFVIQVLWQAYAAQYGTDRVP